MSPRPLRVAHVTLGLNVGGQERLLVEFVRHHDRALVEPCVVSLTGRGVLADAVEALDGRVIAMDEPAGVRPGLVWRLTRLFRAERFDVVHTHDERPLLYATPAALLAGARRVHTHHHGFFPPVNRRGLMLTRWAAKLTGPFVCVSHDTARYLVQEGLPASRVQTIWNGIDLARFPYQGPDPSGPAVCVARLSPEKDIATLLKATRTAVDSLPNFRLEVAGDGPCRAELLRLRDDLGLAGRVTLLGEVRDVPALLARARLFVLPSQAEGISLTILEAMARGLPVVTTRVGGNPEVVQEGSTGLLVPPGDPAALAGALSRVAGDADLAHTMGRAGRGRVEKYFDVRRMVARYEALYHDGRPEPSGVGQIGNLPGRHAEADYRSAR